MSKSKQYGISRHFAAEILNVSLRTLDRYTKNSKISSVRKGRQLFYDENELLLYKQQTKKNPGKKKQTQQKKRTQKKVEEFADIKKAQVKEQKPHPIDIIEVESNIVSSEKNEEKNIYKNLYEEGKKEIKRVQKQYEMAAYRVGQLESKIQAMVPLIELKKEKQTTLALKETNQVQQETIFSLEKHVQHQKKLKYIYATALFLFLLVLPALMMILQIIGLT